MRSKIRNSKSAYFMVLYIALVALGGSMELIGNDLVKCKSNKYLSGDWDGDGKDNLAIRLGSRIFMDINYDLGHDIEQAYGHGANEDEYLVGDWDGDGQDNIAVRRGSHILMDVNYDSSSDIEQGYGRGNEEDEYLVGDWDGDGRDNLAVRQKNLLLMDVNFDELSDIEQVYGNGNEILIDSGNLVFTSDLSNPPQINEHPDESSKPYRNYHQTRSGNPETFNYQTHKEGTRSIEIAAKVLILGEEENAILLQRFNGHEDIRSLKIYAEKVIIRTKLRLPSTEVQIYAEELRFEDGGETVSAIDTTPVSKTTRADQFKPGAHGLKAGDIHLYVKRYHAHNDCKARFIQNQH